MTKVLISGYYGFENFGDEMILSILVNHLKSIDADVTVLSYNPKLTAKKNKIKSVNSFSINKLLFEIIKTDILISGGGSLLQDVTSIKSLIYYSIVILLALIFGKKVIIFAQGIGPLNSEISKFIVFNLLRFCTLVTVRDEKSQKLLIGKKIKATKTVDPAFSIKIDLTIPKRNTVGIQLREFKGVDENFLINLAKNIANNFSDKEIELISLQDSIDLPLLVDLQSKLETLGIKSEISKELNQENIISKISTLDALVAMRFHAIVIALKAGVKTLAINYDEKVEKLAKEFSLPIISLDNYNDYNFMFEKLKNEEKTDFSSFETFDWNEFDKIIKQKY